MSYADAAEQYRSDHGILLSRLPFLSTPLLAAGAVAWLMAFLYSHGWYFMLWVPVVGGLLIGGAVALAVYVTHCRNYWLAAIVGGVTGLTGYLGYYFVCLSDLLPPGMPARIDMLPGYIQFRMQTDVIEDAPPAANKQQGKPFSLLNWTMFAIELGWMVGMPTLVGWRRARRAYCASLGQWMEQDTIQFPPFTGPLLQSALGTDELAQTIASCALPPAARTPTAAKATAKNANAQCRLIVEYANTVEGSALEYPIYASIEDLRSKKPWYSPMPARRTLLRQRALSTHDALTLAPLFPKLSAILAKHHSELGELVIEAPPPPGARQATDIAAVWPVHDSFRQRVRSKGYALKVNLLGLIPVIFLLGGVGLLALGATMCQSGHIVPGAGVLVVSALAMGWGAYSSQLCMGVYENRWIERRLRAEIALRDKSLVNPRDPDAVYGSLIPREHFSKVKLTMASDLLLIKPDSKRAMLLLEGDSDCYQIPDGAIVQCECECFFHPMDAHHTKQLWMVRLHVRFENGMRELLLAVQTTDWRPHTNSARSRVAQALCDRINSLGSSPNF
jgi:hypothetical protein